MRNIINTAKLYIFALNVQLAVLTSVSSLSLQLEESCARFPFQLTWEAAGAQTSLPYGRIPPPQSEADFFHPLDCNSTLQIGYVMRSNINCYNTKGDRTLAYVALCSVECEVVWLSTFARGGMEGDTAASTAAYIKSRSLDDLWTWERAWKILNAEQMLGRANDWKRLYDAPSVHLSENKMHPHNFGLPRIFPGTTRWAQVMTRWMPQLLLAPKTWVGRSYPGGCSTEANEKLSFKDKEGPRVLEYMSSYSFRLPSIYNTTYDFLGFFGALTCNYRQERISRDIPKRSFGWHMRYINRASRGL